MIENSLQALHPDLNKDPVEYLRRRKLVSSSELAANPDWITDARCADPAIDSEIFSVRGFNIEERKTLRKAKYYCEIECKVAAFCLERALADDDQEGTRGGLTAKQREEVKEARSNSTYN